jgi:glycosyltransferase involved in cell wall biosynthesis
MRIAFVYDAIYPYVKGGAERRYHELAKRLSPSHEVHFLGLRWWEGQSELSASHGVTLHGVCAPRDLYVAGKRSISEAIHYSLGLIAPLLRQRFDIVDCSSVPFLPIYVCRLNALLKGTPLIITWHEYWGDFWYQYLGSRWKASLGRTVEWTCTRLADVIVAVSDHTRSDLELHGAHPEAIQVVRNGIDFHEIRKAPVSSRGSDVIFVGRLIGDKKVDELLQAIYLLSKSMAGIKCFVIGDGPERPNLEALSSELGLEANVEFVGFLEDHKDVYAMMKASRVLALPSEREGFGMVVPEANACGLPVVVADARHSAATSLVKQGQTGLLCEPSPEGVAASLGKLLADEAMRSEMRASAMAWSEQFDWDIAARQTEQIYAEVAGLRVR